MEKPMDEEVEAGQADAGVDAGESQSDDEQYGTEESTVDHEARARQLEADNTRLQQEVAQHKQFLETVNQSRGQQQHQQPEEIDDRADDEYATVGEIRAMKAQVARAERARELDRISSSFLEKNADLKVHEKWLSRSVAATNPSLPPETRLEQAAREVRELLGSQQQQSNEASAAAKKTAAKAAGLSTVKKGQKPALKDEGPETNDQYVKNRNAKVLRMQGY
jgi:hypothetical protein